MPNLKGLIRSYMRDLEIRKEKGQLTQQEICDIINAGALNGANKRT